MRVFASVSLLICSRLPLNEATKRGPSESSWRMPILVSASGGKIWK